MLAPTRASLSPLRSDNAALKRLTEVLLREVGLVHLLDLSLSLVSCQADKRLSVKLFLKSK